MKKNVSREIKAYLFFGVLTTIINYSVFAIGIYFLGAGKALQVNLAAFVCATIFAFITNKKYVFKNGTQKWTKIVVEFGEFVFARVFSMGFEQAGLYVCIEWLNVAAYKIFGISGLMIAKIILSFLSVLLNYIASKWIIFASKEEVK